jgi:Meiotically up-regulated gene 113
MIGTSDSDSENLGSNPSSPASEKSPFDGHFSPSEPKRKRRNNANGPRTAATHKPAQSPHDHERRATLVYVIKRADGLCKIGVSRNATRRLTSIQAGHPDKLTLVHIERAAGAKAVHIERGAHLLMRDFHVSGEWFRCQPQVAVVGVLAAKTGELRLKRFIKLMWQHDQATNAWEAARERERDVRRRPAVDERRIRAEDAADRAEEEWRRVCSLLEGTEFVDLYRTTSTYLAWKWRDRPEV